MKHPTLDAQKRTVLGKKVKALRRDGFLPANVYGKDLASVSIQVKIPEFQALFKEVGETGLVDLQLDGKSRPVLIKNLQMNFRTNTPLHADFYQVNLKEKVKTMVPLVVIGEAKAVTEKIGLLLQQLSEVEVEALPEALPENIEVPVEQLAAIDEQITVGDLTIPEGVTVLTDASQPVVKIAEMVVEEPEPEVTAETETVDGETPTEEIQPESDTASDTKEASE
jgi:large subunit ribosomal protein L25